jgi:hypothetical protein
MIDILSAEYVHDYIIELEFSDGNVGCYDLSSILQRNTVLTNPLKNKEYFKGFFIESGALCWKNGLELAPMSIYLRLQETGQLSRPSQIAA